MENAAIGRTQLVSIDMGTYTKEVRLRRKGALGVGHCLDYAPQCWVIVHCDTATPIAAFSDGMSALEVWGTFAFEDWGNILSLEALDPALVDKFQLWVEERLGVNCLAFLQAVNNICLDIIKPSPKLDDWSL